MEPLGRKVGFRYLTSKKSSSFLSIITAISIGGVGVGVLALIVTLSVMSGFEQALKKRLFAADVHILVENNSGLFKSATVDTKDIKAISGAIEQVYPVLQTEVILRSGKKVAGGVLKGSSTEQIDWVKTQVSEWASQEILRAESTSTARLFLGSELALELGVVAGDYVTIVSPVETEGPLGSIPRVKKFLIEGLYKTGVPEQELHTVFAQISDVESFLKQSGVLSQLEIRVQKLEQAPEVAGLVAKKMGSEYLVRPWQEINSHLFDSLRLERLVMFVMLIFIVIVASFNIVSTLTMMVLEKKKSLSILRAIGATRKQIGAIFLWEGLAIAFFGILGGGGIGLLVCYLLGHYPVIELPDVYYDRTLPVLVEFNAVALVIVSAFVIVLLGALAPARKAAQLTPIEGIRQG